MTKLKAIFTKEITFYIIAVILCLFFLTWVMQLWNADLKIPFDYHWDTLNTGASIKGAIDNNGWFTSNHLIGAPYGFLSYDFNSNTILDNVIIKLISVAFPNWALTLNLYFLLTFPLVTLAALFVLRKLKVSPLVAILGSLLFTFLPFHFMQGEPHINLAAYYLIPFAVLLCLWLFEDGFTLKPLLSQISNLKSQNHSSKLKSRSSKLEARNSINWRAIGAIVICLAIGSTFVYYPFFTAFFLLVAGAGAAIARRKWQPLSNAGIMIGIIVAVIVIFTMPAFLYQLHNGANLAFAQSRDPSQTQVWGLNLIELLLPVPGNHNPFLAAIADKYQFSSPFVNENQSAALGILGSIGFVVLVIWLFASFSRKQSSSQSQHQSQISNLKSQNHSSKLKSLFTGALNKKKSDISEINKSNSEPFGFGDKIGQLSILNAAAILLGTVGGLGTVIAYLGFPEIRTYTRISVFIAFFAIITVCWLIDYLVKKTTFSRFTIGMLLVGVMVVGVNDQFSPQFVPDYQGIKQEFLNDDNFVKNIEKTYPQDNLVFQLPYNAFPESRPPYQMQFYDLFRGYLNSTDISWSYGAMKGRYGDFWYSGAAAEPADQMIKTISFSGFNGIYIDGYGYEDGGKKMAETLATSLNVTPLKSANGRLYFFDMTAYNAILKSQHTPDEYAKQQDAALHPFYYEFRDGFSPVPADSSIMLSTKNSEIVLENYRSTPVKITLLCDFETGFTEASNLKIESPLFNDNLKINSDLYIYTKQITVPPGKYNVKFSCDAGPSYVPGKYYSTVFVVMNFKVVENR